MITKRKITALALVITISLFGAGASSCDPDKARELSKTVDTVAEAELRIANFLKESKETGVLTDSDIGAIKPYLIAVNDANRELITVVKKVGTDPTAEQQAEILARVSDISAALNRLNQQGVLRIKDPQKRALFTGLVTTMQVTISSVVVILNKK